MLESFHRQSLKFKFKLQMSEVLDFDFKSITAEWLPDFKTANRSNFTINSSGLSANIQANISVKTGRKFNRRFSSLNVTKKGSTFERAQ